MRGRQKLLGVVGCIAAALALISLGDARGFRKVARLRADVQGLAQRNAALRLENASLVREIEALRKDPQALERAAREELGYVKPGEIVLHVE